VLTRIETLRTLVRQLRLAKHVRPEIQAPQIRCLLNDLVKVDFTYSPQGYQNTNFENWTNEWNKTLEGLVESDGVIPNDGHRTSYDMSFWDRLRYHGLL